MIKNNNRAILRKIAFRSLKAGKMRNIFIIITVAMTAALISGIAGFSAGIYEEEERQLDVMQHVIYMHVTDEQMEALRKDDRVEDIMAYKQGSPFETDGYALCAGYFQKDTKVIKTLASKISEGRYPEKMNEIVVDKAYMERIGKKPAIGAEVAVTWLDGNTENYIVSGYTDENIADHNFTILFSEEYAKKGSQLKDIPYSAAVRIYNAENMGSDEFLDEIRNMGEQYGIERPNINENNMFVSNKSLTSAEVITIVGISIAILLVSVLVIYSIFYISVTGRIRQFGQLRTIGMTSKQIRKVVNREGIVLGFAGIIIGLVIGTIFAYVVKPMGFYVPNTAAIWLIVAAADFITVMVSIRKPAKIAATASPVKAAKLSGYEPDNKTAKHRKMTSFGLAKISVERNRKKFRMTALSLGIAGMLFICGTTLLSSFNREEYSRQSDFYFGEYMIEISSNAEQLAKHGIADIQLDNPLNDTLKANIASLDGVKNITVVELLGVSYEYNDYREDDSATPFDREEAELLSRHREDGGTFDYDKMVMDKEIIITHNDVAEEIFGWRFETGDKVLLRWFDGTEYREDYFKIAGSLDTLGLYNDRDDSGRRLLMGGGWFLIPQELIENMIPDDYILYDKFVISVEDWQNDTTVKEYIEQIVSENSTLSFETLSEEIEERNASVYLSLKYMICGISAFIIGFALINLINTLVSNVMSRKQELVMLRSIGMRQRQLSQMIISEGLILAVRNIIVTSVFGTAVGYALIYALNSMGANYLHWHIPAWYLLGYVMLVIAAPIMISGIVIKILDKKTLVEQLREVE